MKQGRSARKYMTKLKQFLNPINPIKTGAASGIVIFLVEIISGGKFEPGPLPIKDALPAMPICFVLGLIFHYVWRVLMFFIGGKNDIWD